MLTGDSENLLKLSPLVGKNVNLVAANIDIHLQSLWDAQTNYKETLGTDEDLMFSYMMYGPFSKIEDYKDHVLKLLSQDDLYAYVIEYKGDPTCGPVIVGFIAYFFIEPQHRKCEIGHLWLDPRYRRRNIMDEAIFLMLEHAFNGANYRRVQWTCNNRNEASKKMAMRNQFKFEGVLRNYFIAKGLNRDSAWLSIIDSEWEDAKKNLESRIQ